MLQDIQNFSDLTVIDTSALIEVCVKLKVHGDPVFVFSVNDDRFSTDAFNKRYPLNTRFTFRCVLTRFTEGHDAVEVKSVTINGKEILPLYLHQGFPQTSYFNFSEPWVFEMCSPFYPWYHEITGQGWIA